MRKLLQNQNQNQQQIDPYRVRDMLQLMDYSLDQYNPIREEVIQLIRDPETRQGNWDIITLMNSGFGSSTDNNALMFIARDIHNMVEARTGQLYPTAAP